MLKVKESVVMNILSYIPCILKMSQSCLFTDKLLNGEEDVNGFKKVRVSTVENLKLQQ